jgi:ribosome-associated heat shock protein Hsp15
MGGADETPDEGRVSGHDAQRIDRWLWYARFLKSRTLAAALAASGKLRVNGERISRPSRLVRPGDVLTFPLGPHIRTVRLLAPGTRRGPAAEARTLYEDLAPPPPLPVADASNATAPREPGAGRPTKKERRDTDAFRRHD